ncbi:CLUMA_CG003517, isoform A [Clunio marinus]|uniref:CLUMA_CG003517, isoform A n=1 Tax=Clunio marinus TaxID=568069 RepID=A0A1J1HPH7_9DIPT|nr:CLUMA_CG003517, isoform A [Clunio marinus]
MVIHTHPRIKSDQFLGDLTAQLKKTLASETEQDDEVVDEGSESARETELKTIQGNIQWNDDNDFSIANLLFFLEVKWICL